MLIIEMLYSCTNQMTMKIMLSAAMGQIKCFVFQNYIRFFLYYVRVRVVSTYVFAVNILQASAVLLIFSKFYLYNVQLIYYIKSFVACLCFYRCQPVSMQL